MEKSTRKASRPAVAPEPADDRRKMRETALVEARRSLILDAARAAFFELGLEGASLREIAKRAGYTPGAIYSYFTSREEIYAALLGESLDRLKQQVDAAATSETALAAATAAARLRAHALAFFAFYRDNPRDLDLGFYLFNGTRPRGLTPDLNKQLNDRLKSALLPIQEALVALGRTDTAAITETTATFAHAVGLLILNQTGRIRLFHQDAQALFERYLDGLAGRAA